MKVFSTVFWSVIIAVLAAASPACAQRQGECSGIQSPILTFDASSYAVAPFSSQLDELRQEMQANPACRVVVGGTGGGGKIEQQMSYLRVEAIIAYMNDVHGINRNRFIFMYGLEGLPNTVAVRPAADGEDGPSSVPSPHPGLIR